MDVCIHFHSLHWAPIWCRPMQVVCILLQSLWLHMRVSHSTFRRSISLVPPSPLDLILFPPPLLQFLRGEAQIKQKWGKKVYNTILKNIGSGPNVLRRADRRILTGDISLLRRNSKETPYICRSIRPPWDSSYWGVLMKFRQRNMSDCNAAFEWNASHKTLSWEVNSPMGD